MFVCDFTWTIGHWIDRDQPSANSGVCECISMARLLQWLLMDSGPLTIAEGHVSDTGSARGENTVLTER